MKKLKFEVEVDVSSDAPAEDIAEAIRYVIDQYAGEKSDYIIAKVKVKVN